jgi:putative membrane protein
MRLILRVIINAIALWVTALLLPAFQLSGGLVGILIVAVIFGLVNALIRPIVKLLSLPLTLLTLGLFTFVINALMLLLTAWLAGSLLQLEGGILQQFVVALVAGIIITIVSVVLGWLLPDKKKRDDD